MQKDISIYEFRDLFGATAFPTLDLSLDAEIEAVPLEPLRDVAPQLLSLIRTQPGWSNVSRVCLVARVGISSEIRVLSSEVLSGENTLSAGYSCFVSGTSSLFEIPEGHARLFPESLAVVESFAQRRLPIQRSIRRLFASGFRSGICLPLKRDHSFFLFMNAHEGGAFQTLNPRDLVFLKKLTSAIASRVLDKLPQPEPEVSIFH